MMVELGRILEVNAACVRARIALRGGRLFAGRRLWICFFYPTCSEASVVKRIRQMCSCVWVDKAPDSIVLLHCTLELSESLCEVF